MKLAEALILRSDLQKRLEQIKDRLKKNILIQEGDSPAEDPQELLKEFFSLQNDLVDLIKRINRTNHMTEFTDKRSLSDALADRDALLEKRALLASMASDASFKMDRYSKTEIRYISTIDVKQIQQAVDQTSKEYRELDTKIQGLNWNIDLI